MSLPQDAIPLPQLASVCASTSGSQRWRFQSLVTLTPDFNTWVEAEGATALALSFPLRRMAQPCANGKWQQPNL